MAVTKETLCSEETEEMNELRKSPEISSDGKDEAMNQGNGNLIDSPDLVMTLIPHQKQLCKKPSKNLKNLERGSFVLITMSENTASSSTSCSNADLHVDDCSMESFRNCKWRENREYNNSKC